MSSSGGIRAKWRDVVYGSLQLAKFCLIANILYFRILHWLSVWFKWLKKKDFFFSWGTFQEKAKIFLFEASSLGLAPDFSFAVSVCWILLSETHCRLLEIQKTEGQRSLSLLMISVNSVSCCVCVAGGVGGARAHVTQIPGEPARATHPIHGLPQRNSFV